MNPQKRALEIDVGDLKAQLIALRKEMADLDQQREATYDKATEETVPAIVAALVKEGQRLKVSINEKKQEGLEIEKKYEAKLAELKKLK